jgi:sugar phosphate isomerase/epimerase
VTLHPRLSVSEMCTYPMPFGEELTLWDELGVRRVGLLMNKVDAFGRDAAVAALHERSMRATTVITAMFDLSDPTSWDATRAAVDDSTDLAAEVGGCTYFTSGRRDGRSFDELTAAFVDAVAPCVKYAESRGVRLAIEPSLRTDVSFVHTLRDGTDVAERAGIGVIADVGNCWMERDPEDAVRRAGSRVAAVQLSDAVWGSFERPSPGGRVVPGDGDLALDQFMRAAVDAGYEGAFELEMVGPAIEAEGHAAALRRAVARTNDLLHEVLG